MDMKEILKSGIEQALQDTINSGGLPAGEYPEIVLEVPPQKEFGDFSTNIAMQSARVARQNPRAIAEALISHMNFDWLERAEVAGAGFINFFLNLFIFVNGIVQFKGRYICHIVLQGSMQLLETRFNICFSEVVARFQKLAVATFQIL